MAKRLMFEAANSFYQMEAIHKANYAALGKGERVERALVLAGLVYAINPSLAKAKKLPDDALPTY